MQLRMLRVICIITAVCSILLFPLYTEDADTAGSAAAQNSVSEATRWIMIGDSYSKRPLSAQSKTWPNLLQGYLKLDKEEVVTFKGPGYGFARSDKRFYTVIRDLESGDSVKYIVIQSGPRNDRKYSKKTIRKWMKKTARLLDSKYPNARIYYACPNWNIEKKDQKFLKKRKEWYKSISKEIGWKYMSSVQNIYVKDSKWYGSDGHHPNTYGAKKLARAMYKYFKKRVS